MSAPKHTPGEAEIRRRCREIQAGWSRDEECKRRHGFNYEEMRATARWEFPRYRAIEDRHGLERFEPE